MDPPRPTENPEFVNLQSHLKAALLSTTRATSALCVEDLSFHRSLDPKLGRELDKQNGRLLGLAARLLGNVEKGENAVGSTSTAASSLSSSSLKMGDTDALERNWKGVVDVVDSLLEKADMRLDEYTGLIKRGGAEKVGSEMPSASKTGRWPKSLNILKPQRTFATKPANTETGPFKPLLSYKPHAVVPLETSLRAEKDTEGALKFLHPYQTEIEQYKYPPSVYMKSTPVHYTPFESTTATYVDSLEALATMLDELKKAEEIAIDLEHHDTRSYIGIVSLMQISTRSKDWIVDTLKPWRRKLECLNEVFADPEILKVFHGSAMDMVWLQRDFGVYVVGLFDTERAANALRYPGRGLAYLLLKFINFQAQKQHQLADWRQRPLPQELLDYARSDTHFLLYIYDMMRNELIQNSNFSNPDEDLLQQVLDGSKNYQLQRYENPIYDAKTGMGANGWYRQLFKTPTLFSKQQFAVFKALHQWRDNVARVEDDSLQFVMSNHALISIAREMPTTKEKLFSASSQQSSATKQRSVELVALIAQAKEDGENGPEMRDVLNELDAVADRLMANRYAERSSRQPATGFAPTASFMPRAPSPVSPRRPTVVQDAIAAKADTSKFWGALLNGSGSMQQKKPISLDIRLALPLPELTAQIFTDDTSHLSEAQSLPAANPGARAEHAYVPAAQRKVQDADEVFVIKELGGKKNKKRKVADAEFENAATITPAHEADELPLAEAVDSAEKEAKKRRKAEKRAAKEAKRLGQANGEAEAEAEAQAVEEEAFDYANAPSVLHAQNGKESREKRKKKGRDRGIDPYKKALDAPKGLPRAHREKAGRSATFK